MRLNQKAALLASALSLLCSLPAAALSQATAPPESAPASAPAQPTPAATQDSTNDLSVSVGKSVLVDTSQPIERIALASSDLAEATAVSPTEVMVNGKAPGETSLIVWQTGGTRLFFNVTVHASNYVVNDHLDTLRRELRTEFPGQNLRVTSENGLIFLRGSVKNLDSSQRAVEIASTAGKVVNLLYVDVPPADPQILIKVRCASYDLTVAKQLGINLFTLGGANTIGSLTTQQFSAPSITGIPGTASNPTSSTLSSLLNIFVYRPDINLGATIQALQTQGVVQILSEPNLLTANGKEGSFLAGGQFPFPVVQGTTGGGGTGAVTIQFKEFGVRLSFIPTITPRGTIRLQVAPEVSSLDSANGVTISGFTVPGLDVRKVNTEVELAQGQSFAIGGLLDSRSTKNLSKIPFIGDIPVLGKFFQSASISKTNTELIVIVTPEIVPPVAAGTNIATPNFPDKFLPPTTTSPMSNPLGDAGVRPPPPTSIPVEDLIQSLRPERPLVIEQGMSASGGSTTGVSGASSVPAPVGTTTPP